MDRSQPAICEDIFTGMARLLASFTTLQNDPNTSFSHGDGFQPLSNTGSDRHAESQWLL